MHLLVLSAFRLDSVSMFVWIDRFVSMHLLVLSAFRPDRMAPARRRPIRSQCTFWCSVLSDNKNIYVVDTDVSTSQCTFWCSVLSDLESNDDAREFLESQCTFWCSVLSDTVG